MRESQRQSNRRPGACGSKERVVSPPNPWGAAGEVFTGSGSNLEENTMLSLSGLAAPCGGDECGDKIPVA